MNRDQNWWDLYKRLERELGNALSKGDSSEARRLNKRLAEMTKDFGR